MKDSSIMNPEIKEMWITALRSDRYPQGRGVLGRDGPSGVRRYCCLGVLCEIAVSAGTIPAPTTPDHSIYLDSLCYGHPDEQSDIGLPDSVQSWSGLSRGQHRLQTMNDMDRASFAEIADFIETHY